jgi:cardiolipin-specific phospholipase
MSETAFHPGLSPITTLPAVIPPTTRFNFIKNWWHRSEKTSNIAEARMIKRIYDPSPALVPIAARVGRISLDDKKLSNRKAREINTLYISQQQNQTTPFQFESEPTEGLLDVIKSEANPETKNLVMCHGYGAGKYKLVYFYEFILTLLLLWFRPWLLL